PFHAAYHGARRHRLVADAAFIDKGERQLQPLGVVGGFFDVAGVRRDDDRVAQVQLVEVLEQHRGGEEVVGRDAEEAVDLRLVEVHGQDAVRAGGHEEVGDQAAGDR